MTTSNYSISNKAGLTVGEVLDLLGQLQEHEGALVGGDVRSAKLKARLTMRGQLRSIEVVGTYG